MGDKHAYKPQYHTAQIALKADVSLNPQMQCHLSSPLSMSLLLNMEDTSQISCHQMVLQTKCPPTIHCNTTAKHFGVLAPGICQTMCLPIPNLLDILCIDTLIIITSFSVILN
jgi:hypothetical protein